MQHNVVIGGQLYTGGYPYLQIARHYDLPYGAVLSYSDLWLNRSVTSPSLAPTPSYWEKQALAVVAAHPGSLAIQRDVFAALNDFERLQRGAG